MQFQLANKLHFGTLQKHVKRKCSTGLKNASLAEKKKAILTLWEQNKQLVTIFSEL